MKDAKVVLAACLLFANGCASTQQRGWVGGSFVQAGRPFWGTAVSEKDISVLPAQVLKNQKRAVFISRVFPNTPTAKGDLHEGDLVLAVNGAPVRSLEHFRKTVRESPVGSVLSLSVVRDGKGLESKLVVGKETCFRRMDFFIGLPLAPELTFKPLEPRWSILGLVSFERRTTDPELLSPEGQYFRKVAFLPGRESYVPGRRWDLWLGVLGFRSEERILTQQSGEN